MARPEPKLQAVYFTHQVYLGGSQPDCIENKEPWYITFDYPARLCFVECRREGFSQTIWVPFEAIRFVRYEREKV